jgi:hypothetical protein
LAKGHRLSTLERNIAHGKRRPGDKAVRNVRGDKMKKLLPTILAILGSASANAYTTTVTITSDSPITVDVSGTTPPSPDVTTTSLWKPTDTPKMLDEGDATAGVYGVQFTPQAAGNATGCKFYKAAANTGTHVCTLWSNSGAQLATVPFAGETASGWQTQNFVSPVALTANTQYVIGVYDPVGHYSSDVSYFISPYTSDVDGQLVAPATRSTTNGNGNGVYVYTNTATTFPTSTYNASNYWTDVVFQYTGGPPPVSPSTIAGAGLSTSTYTSGITSGAPIGAVNVTMNPASPAFSGTLSLTGTNAANFALSSPTLPANLVANGSTPTCTSSTPQSLSLVATQSGATGSPYTQPVTVTCQPASSGGGGGSASSVPFTALHTYYLSPTGKDSNNGTSAATPWLTPNHPVVCGDVIIAAAGAYTTQFNHNGNHNPGNFGTVSGCPSTTGGIDGKGGIWFATLLCAGPNLGACTANNSGAWAFNVSTNNWAVEGFVHNGSGGNSSCIGGSCGFVADGLLAKVHHVAFINDIAYNTGIGYSGLDNGGDHDVPGVTGHDYWATIGSLAQNAEQDKICTTQLGSAGPAIFDTLPGTHWIAYGNFSFAIPNNGCPYDQESYMSDTWDAHGYTQQTVFLNNVGWSAWRYGLQILTGGYNSATGLHYFVINNTLFNSNLVGACCNGEIQVQNESASAPFEILEDNIVQATNTNCGLLVGGNPSYAPGSLANIKLGIAGHENIAYAPSGTAICYYNGFPTGASPPANITTNPLFGNTVDLLSNRSGVPNCAAFTNVTACMGWNANTSTLTTPSAISDLTPSCTQCTGKGYQKPSVNCGPVNAPDGTVLYPAWLKGIVYLHWNGSSITENNDLVTKPCGL